jgi:Caspase domain
MKQRGVARRGVLAGSASLLAAPAIVRAQGRNGVALVIGNSKYQWEASLPNVKRDTSDIARRFQALGLKTELLQDLGRDALFAALEKFKEVSRGADLAALYFAGHGAIWEKNTHIVPVDADLSTAASVRTMPSVFSIRTGESGARRRLLIFDSCRNNPADSWQQKWAVEGGVVVRGSILDGPNTLVLYSTAPGRAAVDGPAGQNSPFASALLRQLAGPSTDPRRLRASCAATCSLRRKAGSSCGPTTPTPRPSRSTDRRTPLPAARPAALAIPRGSSSCPRPTPSPGKATCSSRPDWSPSGPRSARATAKRSARSSTNFQARRPRFFPSCRWPPRRTSI